MGKMMVLQETGVVTERCLCSAVESKNTQVTFCIMNAGSEQAYGDDA